MSNLVAAPGQSPDFDPRNDQTVRVRDLDATEIGNTDDEIDLRELWRALQRRKKLVAVTAGGVILLAALFTTYQRIVRPIYEGAFSLLITDPISNEGGGRSGMANVEGTMFEQLARNTTSNDIPTLIEVLQSPVLLQPVAEVLPPPPPAAAPRWRQPAARPPWRGTAPAPAPWRGSRPLSWPARQPQA